MRQRSYWNPRWMQLMLYTPENNLEWTTQFNTRKENTGLKITTLLDLMVIQNDGLRHFAVLRQRSSTASFDSRSLILDPAPGIRENHWVLGHDPNYCSLDLEHRGDSCRLRDSWNAEVTYRISKTRHSTRHTHHYDLGQHCYATTCISTLTYSLLTNCMLRLSAHTWLLVLYLRMRLLAVMAEDQESEPLFSKELAPYAPPPHPHLAADQASNWPCVFARRAGRITYSRPLYLLYTLWRSY